MIAFDYEQVCAVRCDVVALGGGVYRIERARLAPLADVDLCLQDGWSVADGVGFVEDLARAAIGHVGAKETEPISVAARPAGARGFDIIAW